MLPVSLDSSFVISVSVFFNIYSKLKLFVRFQGRRVVVCHTCYLNYKREFSKYILFIFYKGFAMFYINPISENLLRFKL